ncbi:MAG TPA: SH3 domain-containing protein [Pseudonocardiaceae bacterium]|nr:SH3 domain-containing protein [Pseudonocardiaceae bacterium]
MFVLSKRMLIVIGVVVVVAVLYAIQSGKKGNAQTGGSTASGNCQVQVTADALNVRSTPESTGKVIGKLTTGAVHTATSTIRNGYRQLAANEWASSQFLKPVSGSC